SKWKASTSSLSTPTSLRHSLKRPTQSLKFPIFPTLPGMRPQFFTTGDTEVQRKITGVFPVNLCAPCGSSSPLLRRKYGRTLLHIRGQAFFRVIALKQNLLILSLDSQSRFHRDLPSGLHRTLDTSDSLCGLVRRRELARVLHDVVHEPVALENVVHDAELLRFFERKRVARNHQLDGFALPYQARQTLRSAGSGKHSEVDFGQADLAGIFAGNSEVGSHGNLEASADTMAVDCGDYELRRVLQAQQRFIRVQ